MKRLIWLLLIGTAFAQYTVPYPSHKKAGGGGGISCTFLGSNIGNNVTTNVQVSFSATTAGHTIFVQGNYSGTVTISDSAGQTWPAASHQFTHSSSYHMDTWKYNSSGSLTSVQLNTGFSSLVSLGVWDCTGLTGNYDVGNQADSAFQSATWTSNATAATAVAASLLIGSVLDTGVGAGQTFTPNAGTWTGGCDGGVISSSNFSTCFMHQVVAATGTYAANGTNGSTTNSDKGSTISVFN